MLAVMFSQVWAPHTHSLFELGLAGVRKRTRYNALKIPKPRLANSAVSINL